MQTLRISLLLIGFLVLQLLSHGQPIIVFGAVPQEIPPVIEKLEDAKSGELSGIQYTRGTLAGKDVIVTATGVGKSYTAMVVAMFLNEFKPSMAFMTGTGARINANNIRTADIIIPSHVFLHDYGSLSDDGIFIAGLQPPGVKNKAPLKPNNFVITPMMHAKALALVETYEPHQVTVDGKTYPVTIASGKVASGDFFGVPDSQIEQLRSLETDIMEMESATFSLVCEQFEVPHLVVRSGSNRAQSKPSDDYLKYGPIAAKSAGTLTAWLIANWN
ncbi:MAG: 5'-methylthioadenosine/S-adenosylhomocysteine nucleosidase [Opitutales bacterium]|nr:5'-methylthioadenosine/S-adenosylhomocysteine nucleosidase [Opitutales bacterium]NRA25668.1 5'-methylthioadenosine/S-adenosylhomocysteine nucleosidase [Opitutales bacterium]